MELLVTLTMTPREAPTSVLKAMVDEGTRNNPGEGKEGGRGGPKAAGQGEKALRIFVSVQNQL